MTNDVNICQYNKNSAVHYNLKQKAILRVWPIYSFIIHVFKSEKNLNLVNLFDLWTYKFNTKTKDFY